MEEIENLCRICMADYEESTSLYTNITKNETSETKTGLMFTKCLNLEVRFFFIIFKSLYYKLFLLQILPNSGYPKEICNHCNLQISVFYNFMTMAKKSHEKFTKKLEALKSLKIEETDQELLNMLEEENLSGNDVQEEEEEEHENLLEVVDNPVVEEEEAQLNWPNEEEEGEEQLIWPNEEEEEPDYQVEYLEEEFNIKKEPESDTPDYFEVEEQPIHSETVTKLYPCKHCDEFSNSKKDHLIHLKTHKSTKFQRLNCHLCDKKFKDQDIFDGHLKVHEGLPAYSCDYCEKTFNYKNNYQTHILLHTNERPFPCTLCEKSFRSKWDLTIHIRVHNDIRKYECNICGKKFRVSSHMTSHQYTHFSKSFECDICFQKYISPRTLKQHKSTVHSDEQPYECSVDGCQKKFKRKHHVDVRFIF